MIVNEFSHSLMLGHLKLLWTLSWPVTIIFQWRLIVVVMAKREQLFPFSSSECISWLVLLCTIRRMWIVLVRGLFFFETCSLFPAFTFFTSISQTRMEIEFKHAGVVNGAKKWISKQRDFYKFWVKWGIGIWTSFHFWKQIFFTCGNLTSVFSVPSLDCY